MNTKELFGRPLYNEAGSQKIGRIVQIVGHPDELRLVGVLVKRPDFLWMFPRKDLFVALDALEQRGDRLCIIPSDNAVGTKALKARSLDWERCILYVGLPIQDEQGNSYGSIEELSFNAQTGNIQTITPSTKALDLLLLGKKSIDASCVQGVKITDEAALVLRLEDLAIHEEEGLAATMGAAYYGKVKPQAKAVIETMSSTSKAQDERVEQFDKTLQSAAYKTGAQLAKTKGMFSAFAEEFNKARKD